MKKIIIAFLMVIALASCATTGNSTYAEMETAAVQVKTPEQLEAEAAEAERLQILEQSVVVSVYDADIAGVIFGSTLDDVFVAMDGVDTLRIIWAPPTQYDLDKRPETAYYIFNGVSFHVTNSIVDEMSTLGYGYNISGIIIGDSADMIIDALGEPTNYWKPMGVAYLEYAIGSVFLGFEVDDDDGVREIALSLKSRK